ncbi:MAG: hypothetical protein R6U96_03735 [Promethearchaeia archaeon]
MRSTVVSNATNRKSRLPGHWIWMYALCGRFCLNLNRKDIRDRRAVILC